MRNLAFASESDLTFGKPVPAGQDGAITRSFGIDPVQAQMLVQSARRNPAYGADPMWVNPGTGWRPKGLGLAGMAGSVPGMGMMPGSVEVGDVLSPKSTATATNTASAAGGSNTITIQAPQGAGSGISADNAPYLLAVGGLIMFGGIFYMAAQQSRRNPPCRFNRRRFRRGR